VSASVSRSSLRHALTLTADSSSGAQRHGLHIEGVREAAVSGECFASINPATGA
jgi:hypothetical protein